MTGIDWGEGLVLRYGGFYGPGTDISRDPGAGMAGAVRRRRLPLVVGGGGVWSFVHIEDAAAATAAAVERGPAGVYQIVDDEPAPCASGFRRWRTRSTPRRHGASPAGSGGSSPARRRPS